MLQAVGCAVQAALTKFALRLQVSMQPRFLQMSLFMLRVRGGKWFSRMSPNMVQNQYEQICLSFTPIIISTAFKFASPHRLVSI